MRVSHTKYNNDGQLLTPRASELTGAQLHVGGQPTTEAGFYHRFKFEAYDAAGLLRKTRRFFDLMSEVPGFSTLSLRPYEVHFGAYYRAGLEIVYVVETPCVGVR